MKNDDENSSEVTSKHTKKQYQNVLEFIVKNLLYFLLTILHFLCFQGCFVLTEILKNLLVFIALIYQLNLYEKLAYRKFSYVFVSRKYENQFTVS